MVTKHMWYESFMRGSLRVSELQCMLSGEVLVTSMEGGVLVKVLY